MGLIFNLVFLLILITLCLGYLSKIQSTKISGTLLGLVLEYFIFSVSNTITYGSIQIGPPDSIITLLFFIPAFILLSPPFIFLGLAITNKIVNRTYKRFKLAIIFAIIASAVILIPGISNLYTDVKRISQAKEMEKALIIRCAENGNFGDRDDIEASLSDIENNVDASCSAEDYNCKRATVYYQLNGKRLFSPGILQHDLRVCESGPCHGFNYQLTLDCKNNKASRVNAVVEPIWYLQ